MTASRAANAWHTVGGPQTYEQRCPSPRREGNEGRKTLQSKSNLQPQADGMDSPISQVPLPPLAASPTRSGQLGASRPGVTVHLRAPVRATPPILAAAPLEHRRRSPRAPPAATTTTWPLGLNVPRAPLLLERSSLLKQPLRLNRARAGGPRAPGPRPSLPA